MGSVFSQHEAVITGSFDFPDVPPAIARETYRDIQAAPRFVPHLVSVNFLRGEPSTVGACWEERVLFRGGEVVVRRTITHVSEHPYTVRVGSETVEANLWTPAGSETFTYVIEPSDDGDDSTSCTIRWTIAFLSTGLRSNLLACCCRSVLETAFHAHVEEEAGHYHKEALRRTVQKMKETETK